MSTDDDGFGFQRIAVRTESRLVIKSTCKKCGLWQHLSPQDGSLEQWEAQHDCGNQEKTKKADGT